MKRLLVFISVVAVAAPAFSFDPSRHSGTRVAVLQTPIDNGDEYEDRIATSVQRQLVRELRDRGFDAVDARMSYEELSVERRASARRQRAEARRSTQTDADFYVEIAPSVRYRSAVSAVVRDAATVIVSGR